jgi:hypothetical protein
MTRRARTFPEYKAALLLFYEEEIAGEAYFARLAEFFDGRPRRALLLLAKMEAVTAAAIAPLLARHGIVAADTGTLRASGRKAADAQRGIAWQEFVAEIVTDYPAFLDEFAQIERLAPAADKGPIDILTPHEVAAIAFAKLEATGDPDSLAPLEAFLDRPDGGGGRRT